MPKFSVLISVLLLFFALHSRVLALETDQFTVPAKPLVDLGPEFNRQTAAGVQEAIEFANARRAQLLAKANSALFESSRAKYLKQATDCLSDEYIAYRVYMALGVDDGNAIEFATLHALPSNQPAYLDLSTADSIYGGSPFNFGIALFHLAPTVNFFGHYLGTDKIGHFYTEGYGYYETFQAARHDGATPTAATRRAVARGIFQEHGIYGEAVDGVYSNGDLAADYAGFRFYMNLTQPTSINGVSYPPILIQRAGLWRFNPDSPELFLRPFISDHLNEGLNPCHYLWHLRGNLRANIRQRGASFVAFYHTDQEHESQRLKELQTWFGEDYGHSSFDNMITIVNAYFEPLIATASK